MVTVKAFTFNPFSENTYLLHDDSKDCIIIDPGCYTREEQQTVVDYLEENELNLVKLVNTHCHIDHILGNAFIAERYNLPLEAHEKDLPTLRWAPNSAHLFGLPGFTPSPEPKVFLKEGEKLSFGNTEMDILFVPGHAPGHVAFVHQDEQFVIGGDVLFREGIGRTDLPGGNMDVLLESIRTELYPLGDDFVVYSGHGPETTIGHERKHNPFVRG